MLRTDSISDNSSDDARDFARMIVALPPHASALMERLLRALVGDIELGVRGRVRLLAAFRASVKDKRAARKLVASIDSLLVARGL